MNKKEIEIQVKIGDREKLLKFLDKNAEFKGEHHQIDEYFTPAHRDFSKVRPLNEWLRLRNSDDKYSINYKYWHHNESGKSHHCDEYESGVEDIVTLKNIFKALDFKPVVVVDKLRKIWIYRDYEITMDSVKNLGDFVEIEYIGKDAGLDPEKVTMEMIQFIKDAGCKDIQRNYVGYAFSLLFGHEIRWEKQ